MKIHSFPKSKKKLVAYVKELLIGWQEEMLKHSSGEAIEEINDTISEQAVEGLLLSNPRILYDFFDKYNIYLQTRLVSQIAPEDGWTYDLSINGKFLDNELFETRIDAENKGFEKCFEKMEEIL